MNTVRKLCQEISQYLYSVEEPPRGLSDLWLAWIESGHEPTPDEMRVAMKSAHPPDKR